MNRRSFMMQHHTGRGTWKGDLLHKSANEWQKAKDGNELHGVNWKLESFIQHDTVTLHNVPRRIRVIFVGGVGDNAPPVLCSFVRNFTNGIVVGPVDGSDLGAICRMVATA